MHFLFKHINLSGEHFSFQYGIQSCSIDSSERSWQSNSLSHTQDHGIHLPVELHLNSVSKHFLESKEFNFKKIRQSERQ